MSTTTSRLGLYKPADDGSEFVDVSTDLNQNLDKLDAALGFVPATSSTPPGSPFAGMARQDTDTGRAYFRNGANSSWVQILAASGSYDSDITFTSGKKIGLGAAPTGAVIDIVHTTTADAVMRFKVTADTFFRTTISSDGFMFGSGTISPDVSVYRSGASELTVSSDLSVDGDLNVGGITTVDDLTVTGDLNAPVISSNLTVSGDFSVIGVGGIQRRYKATATNRASTTTVTDDPDLTIPLIANAVYHFKFFGIVGSLAAADAKFRWSFPTGATGLRHALGPDSSSTSRDSTTMRTGIHQLSTEVSYGLSSNVNYTGILEEGTITTSATAGNLAVQWAQSVSNATAAVLAEGSYLEVVRIV